VYRQVHRPYRFWQHRHEFLPHGDGTSVRDRDRYALTLGALGGLAHAAFVQRDLEHSVDFRRDSMRRLLG
jgi:ligand-binding SRPBCC domain-containing protein